MESIKYSQEGPTLFQVCEIALSATPVAHTHTHIHTLADTFSLDILQTEQTM